MKSTASEAADFRGLVYSALVLGIALGGFFDGILLHQVLQWHHLLSLVPGEAFRDLGTQILADGLFHVLMYLVTVAGLWMLWRRRDALRHAGAAKAVAGGALLGFGIWNVIDVGFFHWILGIHRIRVNVSNPMAYDVGWLLAFGVSALLAGWYVLKRRGGSSGAMGATGGAALSILVVVAASAAALPVPGANGALVVFRPGTSAAAAVNSALAANAPILWADAGAGIMALSLGPDSDLAELYAGGALLVTRSPALAGCAAAARI
jgi:uncharacterized membrane protein